MQYENDRQLRRWFLTINNPFTSENAQFKDIDDVKQYIENLEHFKYAAFQLEKGERGTPHIQAGIIFNIGKRFATIKGYFPTAHIESVRGSNTQMRDYCTKAEGRISGPVEIGKFSEMRSRGDIVEFLELVNSGANNMTLQKLFPALYTQYGVEKIERFRQDKLKDEFGNNFRDIKITYIYGNTRLGKTSYVYNLHDIKDVCRVTNYKVGTFESYQYQKVLVLDEFTGQLDITFLNNVLDKLPIDLPARFSNRTACFTEVYIISNLPVTELYKDEQTKIPEVYKAFTERIHNIIKFVSLGKWIYEKQNGMRVVTEKEDLPW